MSTTSVPARSRSPPAVRNASVAARYAGMASPNSPLALRYAAAATGRDQDDNKTLWVSFGTWRT